MWDNFIYFAVPALIFWSVGAWAAWKSKKAVVYGTTTIGILIFFAYILMMWLELERPPLRTMGETRLWYAFFLPIAGMVIYSRWKYKWLLSFSTIMALVFICINIFKPEIHSKTLMPALQSPWFAPHVIVYMFAYSLFGLAALIAVISLLADTSWFKNHRAGQRFVEITLTTVDGDKKHVEADEQEGCDALVNIALALLTLGMLMGALWAKEAWGHYWAWDPKETWAAITWFTYLGYIHLRRMPSVGYKWSMLLLVIAFCLLQMCWWGVNYLPSAQGMSVHTYSIQ